MRKINLLVTLVLFCAISSLGYAEEVAPVDETVSADEQAQAAPAAAKIESAPVSTEMEIKSTDVNKDGKPDVFYYRDGKYVGKVEADTDYDGKADIVVHVKDGKFESAEVDANHDGKMEQKFTDAKAFKTWLNINNPDFNDSLNRPDWQFDLIRF